MTNPQSLRQRAQAGDPQAIAALMNRSFQQRGIQATAIANDSILNLYLEGETVPNQSYSQRIQQGLTSLGVRRYTQIIVHGRQTGADTPSWSQPIRLSLPTQSNTPAARPTPPQRSTAQRASAQTRPTRTSRLTPTSRSRRAESPALPRSLMESGVFVIAVLGKWVLFNSLVAIIPTFILVETFGFISLGFYLGGMGLIWSRIQCWILQPYLDDRAQHWQDLTQWGFIICGLAMIIVRFAAMPILTRVLFTGQEHWWVVLSIILGVATLGYLLGKLQEPCLEGRWWSVANAGIGVCVGYGLALNYLIAVNPNWFSDVRSMIAASAVFPFFIPIFPEVLMYVLGTGLVLAYRLEIEQQQRSRPTANATELASLPMIPGLETRGRVPLLLPFAAIAVVPFFVLMFALPSLISITLLTFFVFAYQVGSWLENWAVKSGIAMTVIAIVPCIGLGLFASGTRIFFIGASLVMLGLMVVSFLMGAIAWPLSRNWRTAGGLALLGPSLSFALTGLFVLAAL